MSDDHFIFHTAAPHKAQRGTTLIEVLVSVLVLSFGLLGLVSLQARATQYSLDAEDRNRAALFADDLAAQMRLSRTTTLTADQVETWTKRVQGLDLVSDEPNGQGLPNAEVTVTPDGNTATIEIEWRHPKQPEGSESRLVTEVVLTDEEVL